MKDARSIAQDFLDRQGEATIGGDLDATVAWCDLPCTLENFKGRTVAKTEAEIRAICAKFIENLKARRLTNMCRVCREAMFNGDDTICATYETRYIQHGNLLAEDRYTGFVILRRVGDRWKISSMQFAGAKENLVDVTLRDWARQRVDP